MSERTSKVSFLEQIIAYRDQEIRELKSFISQKGLGQEYANLYGSFPREVSPPPSHASSQGGRAQGAAGERAASGEVATGHALHGTSVPPQPVSTTQTDNNLLKAAKAVLDMFEPANKHSPVPLLWLDDAVREAGKAAPAGVQVTGLLVESKPGGPVEISLDVNGTWRRVFTSPICGLFSHCVWLQGLLQGKEVSRPGGKADG